MGLETGTYINDLVTTNPTGTDPRSEGDNHLILLKSTIKASFPGVAGRVWRQVVKSSGPVAPALTENMTILKCTTALTVAPVSATLGNGWCAIVWAQGGDVTIDPNSSEDINGATSITVVQGTAVLLFSTGTGSAEFIAIEAPIPGVATGSSFPSGTVQLFVQSAAPVGWTKGATHDDKALRVVTGSVSTGGTDAFTTAFSSSKATDGYTLVADDLPTHTHSFSATSSTESATHTHSYTGWSGASLSGSAGANSSPYISGATNTGTQSANHTHTVSGTTGSVGADAAHAHDITLDVQYVDVIIATKD